MNDNVIVAFINHMYSTSSLPREGVTSMFLLTVHEFKNYLELKSDPVRVRKKGLFPDSCWKIDRLQIIYLKYRII